MPSTSCSCDACVAVFRRKTEEATQASQLQVGKCDRPEKRDGMIRREVGHEYFLIAQNDHAILAGELAAHFGNARSSGRSNCAVNSACAPTCRLSTAWPNRMRRPRMMC